MVTWPNLKELKTSLVKFSNPSIKDYSHASTLAVVIGCPDSSNPHQFHMGLLYRYEGQQFLLHLGWHNNLKKEPVNNIGNGYFWTDCGVSEEEKQILALQCHRVYKKNGKEIPYGIDPNSCHFDPITAKLISDKPNSGMTCATFVLELFENFVFPLIVREGWPKRRKANRKWQQGIIRGLKKTEWASDEHILAQKQASKRGCMRFPPHEVAAAASKSPLPRRFAWIIYDAEYINNVLINNMAT